MNEKEKKPEEMTLAELETAVKEGDEGAKRVLGDLLNSQEIKEAMESIAEPLRHISKMEEKLKAELQSLADKFQAHQEAFEAFKDDKRMIELARSLTKADLEKVLDEQEAAVVWKQLQAAKSMEAEKAPKSDIDSKYLAILDLLVVGDAVALYELKQPKAPRTYRTKAKAAEEGAITEAPKSLIVPTFNGYQYSMSLYENEGGAYLQAFSSMDGLNFKDGKLFFDKIKQPELEAKLQDLRTKEDIENIDLTALRFYYSILFDQFQRSGYKVLQDFIIVSVPLLTGRNDPKQADIDAALAKIQSYHNVMGVIKGKTSTGLPAASYYQVLNFEYYDKKRNIVAFSSPYMNYVIKTVYNLSIRKTKDGKPKLKKSGEPLLLPSHSYLIDSSIVKERNKGAVENVIILVTLIEQAGDNIPRIKASTLIERNVQLAERLEAARNPRTLLKTTFAKTWELLRTKTRLTEFYKNIQLPEPDDPAFMPTMRTLDKVVFTFPHEGKKK